MRVGFIGLGNVGGKLAGSLLRNGFELTVRDFDVGVAIPLEVSPRVLQSFRQAKSRLGERAWLPNIVVALEEACGERLWAPGFPSEIVDNERESVGHEVRVVGLG